MLYQPRMQGIPFRNTLKSTAVKPTTASSIGAGTSGCLADDPVVFEVGVLRQTFRMNRFSSCE